MTELEIIRRGFAYDRWANARLIAALEAGGPNDLKARKTMAHIMVAHQAWLLRLTADPAPQLDFWPDLPCAALTAFMDDMQEEWAKFLDHLTEEGLARRIAYKTSRGEPFESSISEIFAHVLNHGSYHRGQVAAMIRAGGAAPPATDFILFARGD